MLAFSVTYRFTQSVHTYCRRSLESRVSLESRPKTKDQIDDRGWDNSGCRLIVLIDGSSSLQINYLTMKGVRHVLVMIGGFVAVFSLCLILFTHGKIDKISKSLLHVQEEQSLQHHQTPFDKPRTNRHSHKDKPRKRRFAQEEQSLQQQQSPLPLLKTLVKENQIVANVSFLLDFAIIGFPKCGTTTLQHWLDEHPQIDTTPNENYLNMANASDKLVRLLHPLKKQQLLRKKHKHLLGYKETKDIYSPQSHYSFASHWYNTKLIVSTRHPILWYVSYRFVCRHDCLRP
jgi:hypothetical protein